jgi:hypothetical protein
VDRSRPQRRSDGGGTADDPWVLKTPPGKAQYTMYEDSKTDPPKLVCQVGSTTLTYQLRAITDLHQWLSEEGDWVDSVRRTSRSRRGLAELTHDARNNKMRAV